MSVYEVKKFVRQNPDLERIRSETAYNRKFETHKAKLDAFFLKSPKGNFTQFQRYYGTWNSWLERNEPEWMASRFKEQAALEPDSQDKLYTLALTKFLVTEYAAPECRRITINRMRTDLSLYSKLNHPKSEFPLFWSLLTPHLESVEDFMVRRVKTAFTHPDGARELSVGALIRFANVQRRHPCIDIARAVARNLLAGGNGEEFMREEVVMFLTENLAQSPRPRVP